MKYVWVVEDKEYRQVYLFSSKRKADLFIFKELANEVNYEYTLYRQKVL